GRPMLNTHLATTRRPAGSELSRDLVDLVFRPRTSGDNPEGRKTSLPFDPT
ncbi:hypothetical protein BgiMline_033545, partial [Biomphalaria glabrata]